MSVLMHLSDLHFGAHDPRACAAVQALARALPVSVVVVSGDLTQRATVPQFEAAHAFISALPVRHTLVMPGNHDLPLFAWWERLGGAYRRYARWWGDDREPVCDAGGFFVVGVDTTRAWRHRRGSLSPEQIDRAAQRLAAAPPGRWRIIATHHPLVARHPGDADHRPHRAAEALARWRAAGAELLLSGHAHEPGLVEALPGLRAAQAGTAVSVRLRAQAPNSLLTLETGPAGRQLTRWDFDQETGEFVAHHPARWNL
ncbi:metallophosphoesterase [Acidovorax sp. NCPPB 3859]|nr:MULTISPECIES: metallophosphoesterase [unclassified Acidovorax]MDA8453036.1 metallophosphoesterase [Acidovorax sp. GBBC 3297]MDA8462444.1 metallophosphoesterase [Acidovorax sp. GBBC 3333]MDA8467478.1 metallophosphoesterase [Acidovorax sp. GBBC 3332]MDA8472507.1 metallophosphoesterase [Acidovorax sp. GBBC 3299]WCM77361.1 metallophosphoesterase [Acidovorax sp. GBBC 712]